MRKQSLRNGRCFSMLRAMIGEPCELLITGAKLLGYPDLMQPAVAIHNGMIQDIGELELLLAAHYDPDGSTVKDMGYALLMPGLINAHTHVPMTFLRGFADDLPLMDWLQNHIFPIEAQLTERMVALGARWGMYEMIRTGTTGFVDSYLLEHGVLATADELGLRCVGGEALFAFPSPAYRDLPAAWELYREHAQRYPAGGRVQIALMPHSVYTTSDAVLQQSMELAQELDLMWHIHLSESAAECAQSCELHNGRRPVPYLHDLGLLNERAVLAHMVDVTDEELDLVAESGAGIVHNPVSNMKLASGFAKVQQMINKGIPVGLGTDGACSNNTLNMFESMKLAALLAKGTTGNATAMPAPLALKLATEGGARIFRTPGLGTIAPGAPADIIALSLNETNMFPMYNPYSHAVYAASGKECILTVVAGKILYERGKFTDDQFDDTMRAMNDLTAWIKHVVRR